MIWIHSYTEEVAEVFSRNAVGLSYHIFAGDKQLSDSVGVSETGAVINHLSTCVSDTGDCGVHLESSNWMRRKQRSLGSAAAQILTRYPATTSVYLSAVTSSSRKKLYVKLAMVSTWTVSWSSFKQHITKVANSCFYHLRRHFSQKWLRYVRLMLSQSRLSSVNFNNNKNSGGDTPDPIHWRFVHRPREKELQGREGKGRDRGKRRGRRREGRRRENSFVAAPSTHCYRRLWYKV